MSNEMKRTPGPWSVHNPDDASGYGIDGADGAAVVWVPESSDDGIQYIADAHLIAAAHTHDEALMMIKRKINPMVRIKGGDYMITISNDERLMIMDTLAKARGERNEQ